jgi:hypothetical protein
VERPLRAALQAALRDRRAWAVALLGWLARGGLLIVLLPLLALPSPVGFSIIIGPDIVDATGVPARIQHLLVAGALVCLALVVLALATAAWAERAAFRGRVAGSRSVQLGSSTGPPSGLSGLIAISVLSLIPVGIALVVAADQVVTATINQLIFPGQLDVPLVVRVVQGAWSGVILLAAAVVLADAINASVSRRYLDPRLRARSMPGARVLAAVLSAAAWAIRHPIRLVATVVAAWVVTLAASVVAAAVLSVMSAGLSSLAASAAAVALSTGTLDIVLVAVAMSIGAAALAGALGLVLWLLSLAATVRFALWSRAVGMIPQPSVPVPSDGSPVRP